MAILCHGPAYSLLGDSFSTLVVRSEWVTCEVRATLGMVLVSAHEAAGSSRVRVGLIVIEWCKRILPRLSVVDRTWDGGRR